MAEELDAGLVERHARAWYESYADAPFYPGPWESLDDATRELYRRPSRAQLLSLPIPAAALNAIARGVAAVVPKEATDEMIEAAGPDGWHDYPAMLAASPYAKE